MERIGVASLILDERLGSGDAALRRWLEARTPHVLAAHGDGGRLARELTGYRVVVGTRGMLAHERAVCVAREAAGAAGRADEWVDVRCEGGAGLDVVRADWRRLGAAERHAAADDLYRLWVRRGERPTAFCVAAGVPPDDSALIVLSQRAALIDAFETLRLTSDAGLGTTVGDRDWLHHLLVTADLGVEQAEVALRASLPVGAHLPLAVWLRSDAC